LRGELRQDPGALRAHYYLALALLRGRRPARLTGPNEVRMIERSLTDALGQRDLRQTAERGQRHAKVGWEACACLLWAWIKEDFYAYYGVHVGQVPRIQDLLREAAQATLDPVELRRLSIQIPPDAPHGAVRHLLNSLIRLRSSPAGL
jgi:hypothetical protein